MVEEQKSISVQELMSSIDASESTIRRDIAALDKEGLLVKVHGGAVAKEYSGYRMVDDAVEERAGRNREEKLLIARYAASLIEDRDMIYIDAGTTTELMIDYIEARDVRFVTNAIGHARLLSKKGYKVYLLGGEFKAITEAIVGEEALFGLDKYNFTKGFFGTNGIDRSCGFTTPDVKEAALKKKAMQSTKENYILGDSTKFSKISAVTFAAFDKAVVITDSILDNNYKNAKNIVEVN